MVILGNGARFDSQCGRNLGAPEIHWMAAEGAWYMCALFHHLVDFPSEFRTHTISTVTMLLELRGRSTTSVSSPSNPRRRIYGLALGHSLVSGPLFLRQLITSMTTDASTGRITIPNRDVWAIDPTILVLSTGNYLVYSSWDGAYQCLWISYVFGSFISKTRYILIPSKEDEQRHCCRKYV